MDWGDGDRSERKPVVILPTDLDRREGNLPDSIAIDFGHQGDGQGVVGPQAFDDQLFCLVAKGVIRKCRNQDLSDGIVIAGCFGATEALPAEAGRFGDFVNSGLKSSAHEGVTRKLSPPSSGSVPSWLRMYSMIASSVTLPLEATK